ncbi:metalloregulator ArsR/SmtB family transcription factor [Fructilactobacillus vespulae]|uniref:ArsR/SmtB family transcription factor n=1 Tax=Fructilactobacillus vespulae TaxID=1249630 RepID=UPI0039B577DA
MDKELEQQILAETTTIYKLLSNPTRIKILYLLENQTLTVGELAKRLAVAQSIVSHQLASLRKHQLISFEKQGKYVYYKLDDPHILSIIEMTFDHVEHVVKGEPHQYHLQSIMDKDKNN